MPVIGYVNSGTAGANVKNIAAFRAGLTEAGFVMDDGVVTRIAQDRFHVTTTTGAVGVSGQAEAVQ